MKAKKLPSTTYESRKKDKWPYTYIPQTSSSLVCSTPMEKGESRMDSCGSQGDLTGTPDLPGSPSHPPFFVELHLRNLEKH